MPTVFTLVQRRHDVTVPSLINPAIRRLVTRSSSSTPTAQSAAKHEVVERKLLAAGFIISLKPPAKLNRMAVPDTGEVYEQFGVPVKGGYINCHFYNVADCQRRGNHVWVEAKVFEKTMEGNLRRFYYLDLRPTTAEHLSHEMKIYQEAAQMPIALPEGSIRFDCPDDIKGVIAFLPRQRREMAEA